MATYTPRLTLPEIAEAQAQKYLTHNEGLAILDALVMPSVLSATTTAPPLSPSEGDAYIVPPGATGAWASHDGDLTEYQNAAWAFFTPTEGWSAWVIDESARYVFAPAAWGRENAYAEVAQHFVGKPTSSQVVFRFAAARAGTITGGAAVAAVAATASAVFSVKVNGSGKWNITFGAGQTVGVFTMSSEGAFVADDVITIVGPASADATLENLGLTLTYSVG
jgi:hypothetical protein